METSSLPRWVLLLFVVAFALVGYLFYTNYNDRQAARAALDAADKKAQAVDAEFGKTNARIADLQAKLDVTSQKLGLTQDELARARGLAQSIKKDQLQSDEQLRQQIGAVQADTTTKFGQVTTEISTTKSDVAATKADLEATKSKLQSTVGDLGVQSGLIARIMTKWKNSSGWENATSSSSPSRRKKRRSTSARSRCFSARPTRNTTSTP